MGLISQYKLKTRHLLQDVLSAPGLLMRGKLKLLPPRIEGQNEVERIFGRAQGGTGVPPVSAAEQSGQAGKP